MKTTIVYLLHFSKAYKRVRHYIGSTTNLEERVREHMNGQGSKLMKAVSKAGIKVTIARTWSGDRNFERFLKNQKNSKRFCPLCGGIDGK